ncbi:MAG: CoA transferase [Chloroflexi bacterium]|nr:CoA transferase [Chloroflexota bacterium]
MTLPLDGVRVLDLSDHRAALGSRTLADLGAAVTMVEPPGGSSIRHLAPFVDDAPSADGSYQHLYFNVNKGSIVLDWRVEEGMQRLLQLVGSADILIESNQPGEFPVDEVRSANPHLIVVSATPYGQRGPRSGWRATDLTATAAGGLLQISGERTDPPVHGAAFPAHTMTGLTVASSAMTALHGRDRTPGQPGCQIDISMQEATSFQTVQTSNPNIWRWRGEAPYRPALSQVIRCADDRWMACNISPNKLPEFIAMLDEAGIEHDLDPDNWVVLFRGDRAAWQYLENPLQDMAIKLAAVWPRQKLLDRLWACGTPAMPTLRFSEFAENEHYQTAGQFSEVDTPAIGRSLSYSRSALDPVQSPLPMRPAPKLGEHSDSDSSANANGTVAAGGPSEAFPDMPLAGIRVLDLTWVAAGPLTTRLMANFGAEVIKVESSGERMDPLRVQPIKGEFHFDLPDLYNEVNTGKKSVTIDLADERGKDLLRELVAHCDVLTNNYSGGSLARMGFPWEQLRAINPRLISVHLPGVGGDSPWRPLRTLGNLLKAASGMNFQMGYPDQPPRGMGVAYPDFTTPHLGVTAILSALRAREETGEGREIELSQLSATVALLGAQWMQFDQVGEDLPRPGNRDPNMCPHGVFPSTGDDQWVAIALESDEQWPAFVHAIGRPEWAERSDLRTLVGRKACEDEIESAIGDWTSRLSKWHAAEQLQAAGIAANAVEDLRDMMDIDEHFRDHYQHVQQPSHPGVDIWIDGAPWEFAHLEPRVIERAPMLGEHNEEVLSGLLGKGSDEIAELIAAGVVG